MEEEANTAKREWIGFYQVEREDKTLIVHAYETAGEQWRHGYKIFLSGKGENNFKLLHQSDQTYHKRDRALEAGKLHAENYNFRVKSKLMNWVKGLAAKVASL